MPRSPYKRRYLDQMEKDIQRCKRNAERLALEDDWYDERDLFAYDQAYEYLKRRKMVFSLEGQYIFYEFDE